MFRNLSKLSSLFISTTKFICYPKPINLSQFIYYPSFHSISSILSSDEEYSKLINLNNQIQYEKPNFQQIMYFSKIPHRKRNRKRGNSRNDTNLEYDSRIPKLVYLHNPIKYLKTKLKFLKLKLRWDRKFNQKEFIRGTKQAAVVLTNVIRTQNFDNLGKFTTRIGFHQITRDMILSKTDPRLQMIQLRNSDLRRAIPVKVMLHEHQGYRHCLIDMFFVGMRNVNDFKSRAAHEHMSELIKKFETMNKTRNALYNNENQKFKRIIFAEIFIRFYRDYTDRNFLDNWNVSFYKVLNFDVLHIRDTQK